MKRAELEPLGCDELIAIILHLQAELETLPHRIAYLETPLSPPPISWNSSQPPSQDQKANCPPGLEPYRQVGACLDVLDHRVLPPRAAYEL
jgi:hypothetical protein